LKSIHSPLRLKTNLSGSGCFRIDQNARFRICKFFGQTSVFVDATISASCITSHSPRDPAVCASAPLGRLVLVYRRNRLLCSRHCVDLNNAICCSLAFRSSSTQHVNSAHCLLRSRHSVDLDNAIRCSLAFRSSSTQHVNLHTVSSAVGTASTSIMRFVAGWPFSVRQTPYFVDGFKFVVNTWEYKDMHWPDLMSLPLPVSPLLLSVLRPSPCPKRPSTYF